MPQRSSQTSSPYPPAQPHPAHIRIIAAAAALVGWSLPLCRVLEILPAMDTAERRHLRDLIHQLTAHEYLEQLPTALETAMRAPHSRKMDRIELQMRLRVSAAGIDALRAARPHAYIAPRARNHPAEPCHALGLPPLPQQSINVTSRTSSSPAFHSTHPALARDCLPTRPGALDYQAHPSRTGQRRTPHAAHP